ncbi:hypothetical protein CASFOL_027023 [Castilleja foliolosa]|uniref:Uncharacterized protein n=1 Tax=Castilleja foliolosa TaxID=1961234 RepID=A0ABD3CLI9_9LAMI
MVNRSVAAAIRTGLRQQKHSDLVSFRPPIPAVVASVSSGFKHRGLRRLLMVEGCIAASEVNDFRLGRQGADAPTVATGMWAARRRFARHLAVAW